MPDPPRDPAPSRPPGRLLVLGLGNRIASDDAVGLLIVDRLAASVSCPRTTILPSERGGLEFIDLLTGYNDVIVVDSIRTGRNAPGEIIRFRPEEFSGSPRGTAVHDVSLFQALELGRMLGLPMPARVEIIAVEIIENRRVAEKISPPVQQAMISAAAQVAAVAREMGYAW
ncbi:MAG: hydrogenase maturation protease [Candidatus Eisenbacteria bacterium]|nr:hydrogenase maturation protease [Candidatus Eisenbacteria bacterium]